MWPVPTVCQDDCGAEKDLSLWARLINSTGPKPVMIENCHWGRTLVSNFLLRMHIGAYHREKPP
jgi:hypothetical protein